MYTECWGHIGEYVCEAPGRVCLLQSCLEYINWKIFEKNVEHTAIKLSREIDKIDCWRGNYVFCQMFSRSSVSNLFFLDSEGWEIWATRNIINWGSNSGLGASEWAELEMKAGWNHHPGLGLVWTYPYFHRFLIMIYIPCKSEGQVKLGIWLNTKFYEDLWFTSVW